MANEWIMCKDRTPEMHEVDFDGERWEESDVVLVCGQTASGEIGYAASCYINDEEEGEKFWYEPFTCGNGEKIHVKAWMPISAPDFLDGDKEDK